MGKKSGACEKCPFLKNGQRWPSNEGENFMRTVLNPEQFPCHYRPSKNSDCLGSIAREAGKLHEYEDLFASDADFLRYHLQSFTEPEGYFMGAREILKEAAVDNEMVLSGRED